MDPVLFTQLNNGTPTASKDCAVETIRMGIAHGTRQRWVPTVRQVREAAGNLTSGLTMRQWQAAVTWCEREAARRGFPIDVRFHRPAASVATLRDELREGRYAGVAIDYKVINAQAIEISGQRNLTAYHGVGLWRLFKRDGVNRTVMYDPLYDGRRRLIPNGPTEAPFPVIRDAMAGYAGRGLFLGFTVAPAAPPSPEPEPESQPEESPVKLLRNFLSGQVGRIEAGTPVFHPETGERVTSIVAATDRAQLVGTSEDGKYRGVVVTTRHIPGGSAVLLVEAERVTNVRVEADDAVRRERDEARDALERLSGTQVKALGHVNAAKATLEEG